MDTKSSHYLRFQVLLQLMIGNPRSEFNANLNLYTVQIHFFVSIFLVFLFFSLTDSSTFKKLNYLVAIFIVSAYYSTRLS